MFWTWTFRDLSVFYSGDFINRISEPHMTLFCGAG